MGILLGLATGLSWGFSDFLARFATHRIGTLRTMFYMQASGFVLLTLFLLRVGAWGHLFDGSGWQPWAWGVFAGLLNAVSTLSLYRSFEIGKLAIVAPLSASYPALTVLLSLATGEHLSAARAAGILLTLIGVVFVAAGEAASDTSGGTNVATAPKARGTGVLWALCASLGFGVLFWLLGNRVIPQTGAFASVWMIRLTCTVVTWIVLQIVRQPLGPLARNTRWQVAGMGVFDTGAFVMNNRGMQLEQVAIVSVLSSLYGAVTVALAAIVLREHIRPRQWVGIVFIFAGIYLISR